MPRIYKSNRVILMHSLYGKRAEGVCGDCKYYYQLALTCTRTPNHVGYNWSRTAPACGLFSQRTKTVLP